MTFLKTIQQDIPAFLAIAVSAALVTRFCLMVVTDAVAGLKVCYAEEVRRRKYGRRSTTAELVSAERAAADDVKAVKTMIDLNRAPARFAAGFQQAETAWHQAAYELDDLRRRLDEAEAAARAASERFFSKFYNRALKEGWLGPDEDEGVGQ